MRPIYETTQDRVRENEVALYLETKYACRYTQAPKLSPYDGSLSYPDGRLAALVEIKTRRNAKDKYPTYMLSAAKWRSGLSVSADLGVPFLLFVRFTDGLFTTKLKESYPVQRGGRWDRGDTKDVEDCVFIPMVDFREA